MAAERHVEDDRRREHAVDDGRRSVAQFLGYHRGQRNADAHCRELKRLPHGVGFCTLRVCSKQLRKQRAVVCVDQ
ncbi:hypothetical protein SDC9_49725 [bioreactor metagenome]|uniref:Uncharacterized protein n=1 Tax=bioreactor metagenome TaxID=1076179 RepID=A0A644WIZ7_9ZZZZ